MFDVGFSELIIIAIVALVVIGPERLPKVARTAGHLLGRLQRYVNDVKADISREMQLDELKKLHTETQDSVQSLELDVASEMQALEQSIDQAVQPAQSVIQDLSTTVTGSVTETRVVTPAVAGESGESAASSQPASQAQKG